MTGSILYIGGAPRSGSTMLSRALAQDRRIAAAGELNELWQDGFLGNARCSCGKRFRACQHWRAVVRQAFGGFSGVDARGMARWSHAVTRRMYLPPLSRGPEEIVLGRLYRAIASVTGAGVIVDSSKSAGYARVLARLPDTRLTAIHLIRDSRAVAYSWSRRTVLPRLSIARACTQWNAYNLPWVLLDLAGGMPIRRVRYEAFAANPVPHVRTIRRWVGLPPRPDSLGPRTLHILSGNPSKAARGPLRIVEDVAWEKSLPPRDRRLATALTWPLLAQFGYLRR